MSDLPLPLLIGAIALFAALLLATAGSIYWSPKREKARAERRKAQREAERTELRVAAKRNITTDQLPVTDVHPAPRKLPGQDRLTRKDVHPGQPAEPPAPAISAAADDHPGGAASPSQRPDPAPSADPTALMRAVQPPVPPGGRKPRLQAPAPHVRRPEPETVVQPAPKETRAERRRRLDAEDNEPR